MPRTDARAVRPRVGLRLGGIVALGVLCLLLAAIAFNELDSMADDVAPAPARQIASSEPHATPATFELPPASSFSAILERPIFAPTRRPPPPGGDDASGPWSAFILSGIIITGEAREALVVHGQPEAVALLREGQRIEGWTVTAIRADRIVLAGQDGQHELKLHADAKSGNAGHSDAAGEPPPRRRHQRFEH